MGATGPAIVITWEAAFATPVVVTTRPVVGSAGWQALMNGVAPKTLHPPWSPAVVQGLADVLASTDWPAMSNSQISRLLRCSADPHRFTDAKARKNYAGTSPITRASGTRTVVLARYARNQRLGDAIHQWAFCALKGSPGARAYYDALRTPRHRPPSRTTPTRQPPRRHPPRLRLRTNTAYDEATAWAHLRPTT